MKDVNILRRVNRVGDLRRRTVRLDNLMVVTKWKIVKGEG